MQLPDSVEVRIVVVVAADVVAAVAAFAAPVQGADADIVVAEWAHVAYQVADVLGVVDTVVSEVRLVDQAVVGTFAFVEAQLDDVVVGCVAVVAVLALVVVAVLELAQVPRLARRLTLKPTCPQVLEEVMLER